MTEQPQLPPHKLAFIIDGEVADVLHTDARLAAIFLSNPLIVDITEDNAVPAGKNIVGYGYNPETNVFTEKPTA
jgi:hypothetical protein